MKAFYLLFIVCFSSVSQANILSCEMGEKKPGVIQFDAKVNGRCSMGSSGYALEIKLSSGSSITMCAYSKLDLSSYDQSMVRGCALQTDAGILRVDEIAGLNEK